MRQNSQEVTLPLGFMRDLATARSEKEVLAATAKWMPSIVTAERSSIALPHSDDTHLVVYALSGSLIIPQGALLSIEGSLVGEAFRTKDIVCVTDLVDSSSEEAPMLVEAGLRSALVCPLTAAGRCLGTVNLGNSRVGYFTEADAHLVRAVVDLIASFLGVHQNAKFERQRANTDHLTKLLSRRGILGQLDERFRSGSRKPSLLYIDVDGFKSINDSYGHLGGDDVLRVIAMRIANSIRDEDRVGRLGGDEFLVVLDDDPEALAARCVAETIAAALATPVSVGSISVQPKVSMGIAAVTGPSATARTLLLDADQALYRAKGSDVAIAVADQELRNHSKMIATIDRDLDHGMESNSICFHYQPIRDLQTRQIKGAEALIRWEHPELGPIPPPLLIERLETTGRTQVFTRWAVKTIVENWATIRSELPWFHDKAVAVNLSPRQLAWEQYAGFHFELLERHGFRPSDVIVEVVESTGIHVGDAAEATLQQLGAGGAVIALDDFGTGHNALSYFNMFPVHAVKLDRSLVSIAHEDFNAHTILTGLASMFHRLGVTSLGEGIETEADAKACEALSIVHGQGWHFGRPAALDAFVAMARTEGPPRSDPLVQVPARRKESPLPASS